MVVREGLGHVLVDLTVAVVEHIILWPQQKASEPCSGGEKRAE